MVSISYANAYKEVLVIINNLVKDDYDKIPKEYIKFLESNCNNNYKFEYDKSKTFSDQDLLDDTKYILFGLFEKFGATENQKAKIKSYKINYNNKLEDQKKEKYNYEDIFKRNTENEAKEVLLEIKSEKWYKKLISFFRNMFKN